MANMVLIIDDDADNRAVLTEILEDSFKVVAVETVVKGLLLMKAGKDDLASVFVKSQFGRDAVFRVLDEMKKLNLMPGVPCIMIESGKNTESADEYFEYGATDFIFTPFSPSRVLRRVKNSIRRENYALQMQKKILSNANTTKLQYQMLQKQSEELKKSQTAIINAIGSIVEYRNLENGDHVRRVRVISEILGHQIMESYPEYHLTEEELDIIGFASMLHDVGKITIPDSIMMKPGKLNQDEFEIMKAHTTKGCEILEEMKGAWGPKYTQRAKEICRSHHERYDGNGYPDGLKGEEIPISAQLVAIADAYDALVSERIYKKAYRKSTAYEMIQRGECGVFSPRILFAFQECRDLIEAEVDQTGLEFEDE